MTHNRSPCYRSAEPSFHVILQVESNYACMTQTVSRISIPKINERFMIAYDILKFIKIDAKLNVVQRQRMKYTRIQHLRNTKFKN